MKAHVKAEQAKGVPVFLGGDANLAPEDTDCSLARILAQENLPSCKNWEREMHRSLKHECGLVDADVK